MAFPVISKSVMVCFCYPIPVKFGNSFNDKHVHWGPPLRTKVIITCTFKWRGRLDDCPGRHWRCWNKLQRSRWWQGQSAWQLLVSMKDGVLVCCVMTTCGHCGLAYLMPSHSIDNFYVCKSGVCESGNLTIFLIAYITLFNKAINSTFKNVELIALLNRVIAAVPIMY